MTPSEMKAHLSAFMQQIWNDRDLAQLNRFITPLYVIMSDPGDPWDGKTLTRAQFAERLTLSCAPFPDQRFTIADMTAEATRIAVDWRWRGTHLADLPGFPASGRTVNISGITVYYFTDGLICGHRQQTDRLGVFQQLTAKP
ncbi:MAG: ester cyclase [Parvularculaceae bacterium]|nr:ester cyclase [Parvularculaceae bacterium]